MEGQNQEICEFMAININPIKIFEHLINLLKKNFVFQMIQGNPTYKNPNIVTADMENQFQIGSVGQLLDLYYKNSNNFQFNNVMKCVVKLFEFIKMMGVTNSYYIMLREQDKQVKHYRKKGGTRGQAPHNPQEQLTTYMFIKQIFIDIEVIDNENKLQHLFFYKVPECFYLSL